MDRSVPDYIERHEDGSVTVTLIRGLEIDGARVMALRLRESTVDDEKAATKLGGKSDFETGLAMIALLAEISPKDLGQMSSKDKRRVEVGLELVFFE